MFDELLNDTVRNDTVLNVLGLSLKAVGAYIAIVWMASAYWTYRDIRRRTRSVTLQVLAVTLTLVFFVPGYWLYLVLRPRQTLSEVAEERFRERLFEEYGPVNGCPNCKKHVRPDYIVCPNCQAQLRDACVSCSHAMESRWAVCPYCGSRRVIADTPSTEALPAASRQAVPL